MEGSRHNKISELTRSQMERFLRQNTLGRLGLCFDDVPYVVPVSYIYHDSKIYFHTTTKGKKMEFIQRNNQTCFEVDGWDETGWLSVICYGKVSLHDDFETKKKAFEILSEFYQTGRTIPDERIKSMNVYIGVVEIEQMTGRKGQMAKPAPGTQEV